MTASPKKPTDSLYRALFSQSEQAMVIADSETGAIVAANKEAERLTGYSRSQLLGKKVGELWTDSEPSAESRKTSVRSGDGTQVEAAVSKAEFEAGGRRYAQYTLEAAPDLSQQQQTRLLYELVDNFDDSVLITDLEGKIVYINKKGLSDLGYALPELEGKDASVLQDSETYRGVGSEMLKTAQRGDVWSGETTVLTKDGVELYCHVTAFLARDAQGSPLALVAIAREVSRAEIERRLKFFQSIAEGASEPIFLLTPEGKIAHINRAGLERIDRTEEEVVGQPVSILQDPADFERDGHRILASLLSGEGWSGETWGVTKSGERFPLHFVAFPVSDSFGRPIAIVGISSDLTRLKEAEKQAARLSEIVESATEAIHVLDAQGRIVFMNRAGLARIGYSADEVIGKHISILMRDEDFAGKGSEILSSVMAGERWSGEILIRPKSGPQCPVHLTVFPSTDSDGKPDGVIGFSSDMTRLREAESQARLLSEIIENASQGVFTLDAEGNVTYINKAGLERLGRTYEDVIGKHFSTLADTEASRGKLEAMVRALEEGSPWFDEVTAMKKTGERYSVEITAFPVRDAEGRLTAVVGTSADITRLKEAESQAKRLAAVVESSADMICITDPNGRITYANRAMLQLTQMSREELLGASPADFIFPKESGAGFETIITSTKEAGYEGEVEWRAGDGSVRTLWIRAFRIDDPTTAKPSLVYVFTDVTEQRWLRRELERRHAHAEAINKMAFALRELLSTEQVLDRSLEVGIDVTGADVGGIYFLDDEGRTLRLAAWRGTSPEQADRLGAVPLTERLREVLYGLKTAAARDDLATLGDGLGKRMTDEGLRSGIMTPLWSRGTALGAMFLATTEPRTFDSQDLDLATSLGSIVAAASERARLFEEAQHSAMRLSLLAQAQRAILSKISVEEIVKDIGGHIQHFFPSSIVGLALVDETGENLVFERVASGAAPDPGPASEHRVDEMAASLALRDQRSVVRKDIRTEEQRFAFDEQCISDGILSSLIVPLTVANNVIGTLNIGSREVGAFGEEDIPLAEEIANVVAVAIDNARLYSEVKKTAERLSLANEVGQAVLSTLSADEILREIAAWARRILPCERVSLAMLDPSRQSLLIRMASTDAETGVGRGEVLRVGDTALGLAVTSQEPMLVRMEEMKKRFPVEKRLAAEGIECAIAAPLRVRDEVLGTLNVGSRKAGALTDEHIAIMEELANLTAMALEKARTYEAEIRRSRQLEALRHTAECLLGPTELDRKFLAVMGCIRDSLGFDAGSIALVSDDGKELVRRARFDSERGEYAAQDTTPLSPERMSASSQAMYAKSPVLVEHPLSDPRCATIRDELEADGTKALVNIPILAGGKPVGLICADRTASNVPITGEDVELLKVLAQQTGLAIQNNDLIEETRRAYEELKGAQEARITAERMTALGLMAREVTHDINNLLSVIAARCEFILDDGELSDESRTHAHAAHEKTMEGAEIVRRMQDAARVRKTVAQEPIDMNSLAQEAVWITEGRWRYKAAREGIRYEVKADLAATRLTSGSQGEIKQAAIDLIYNALDRNPAGGAITVETRDDGDSVVCSVVDPGPVPTDKELRALFRPFSARGTDGEELQNSLSIAKATVERHGGDLSVKAHKGGTAFTMKLPAAVPLAAARGPRARPAAEPESLKILLVEDEPQVRELTSKMLSGLGHQTETAVDGEEALRKLASEGFDLLMTDLGLPGIDGWEVARRAKEHESALPVVLITGWGDQISENELEVSGVDAIVVKPFTKKKLSAAIADALSERK